ncbi:MAG: hypothetical protein AAB592_05195, partial [Patescibacteria group bacterium]
SELILTGEPGDRRLYHIAIGPQDNIPANMLLVGDPDRAQKVADCFDGGRIEGSARHREFVTFWGVYRGVRVAVMGTGIGVDNAEIASVELHAVHEYDTNTGEWAKEPPKRRIIRIGTSASPQADVSIGSVAISDYAIGLDNAGLSYLHHPKLDDYEDPLGVYYTPDDPTAKAIFDAVRREIWDATDGVIRPYVSAGTPSVMHALQQAATECNPTGGPINAFTGITSSAPGFFGPQGRSIGRLSNIILPDLQNRLARVSAATGRRNFLDDAPVDGARTRPTNNEMEASLLFRLNGEILGHDVGAVCAVIANRNAGEFVTPELYERSEQIAIDTALGAMVLLDRAA